MGFDEWIHDHADRLGVPGEPDSPEARLVLFGIFRDKLPGGPISQRLIQRGLVHLHGDGLEIGQPLRPPATGPASPSALPNNSPSQGLSRRRVPRKPAAGTVFLPREVALHYLALCAADAASTMSTDLFAEDHTFASTALATPRHRASLTTRLLRLYLPENLATVPFERILELRNDLSLARAKYQMAVQDLVTELLAVSSASEATRLEARAMALAADRVDYALTTYKRARTTVTLKALGATLLPASVSSLASMLGIGLFEPAALAAGVAAVTATYLSEKESARATFERDPWSYVGRVAGGLAE
jgi:hypothetical protein